MQIYTIWNFRREALASVFEAGGEAAKKASDTELALTHVGGWRLGWMLCFVQCAMLV